MDAFEKNEQQLLAMKEHLKDYLEQFFNAQDNENEDFDFSKFDITFEILGKRFTLMHNADLYNDLEAMVQTQIDDM